MITSPAFTPFLLATGLLYNYDANAWPTRLHGFDLFSELPATLDEQLSRHLTIEGADSTFYGFVYDRPATLVTRWGTFMLQPGMYFCVPGSFQLIGGRGIIIERIGYAGVFSLGGPIDPNEGRLAYIDGCTDTLLVPPVKLGDPCLNALYFPPGTDQTEHTHPSMRVGMVVSGEGECVVPEGTIPLFPGQVFIIHEDGLHKFRTLGDSSMVVIAYHPDSDYGPTDQFHPMINRTIVNGVSASFIEDIRTKREGE
jgi:hypothetical protein